MILLVFCLIAELVVAFLCFIALKHLLPKHTLSTLALIAALAGLPASWFVGYSVTRAQAWNIYYALLNQEYEKTTGSSLTAQQFNEYARKLQDYPGFELSLHKDAALHAVPAFIIVLIALRALAKRSSRKKPPKE